MQTLEDGSDLLVIDVGTVTFSGLRRAHPKQKLRDLDGLGFSF